MTIKFDFTEVNALAADLGKVAERALPKITQAVQVSAQDVRDDWRAAARGMSGRHARAYPSAIDYDMKVTPVGPGAEVGPSLGKRQGSLGFLEEGVPSVGTGAQHASRLAVRANQDDFIRGLQKAISDPLED